MIILDELLARIEFTGRYINEPTEDSLHRHLVLTEEEFNKLGGARNIKQFATENNLSLISISYTGEIDIIHYTSPENLHSIEKSGLIISKENQFIMDMGNGIYCIEDGDEVGFDNLYKYFDNCEKLGEEEILKVTGSYNGPYLRCIYGYGHKNYILLKRDVPKKDIILDISSFEESFGFLTSYDLFG